MMPYMNGLKVCCKIRVINIVASCNHLYMAGNISIVVYRNTTTRIQFCKPAHSNTVTQFQSLRQKNFHTTARECIFTHLCAKHLIKPFTQMAARNLIPDCVAK